MKGKLTARSIPLYKKSISTMSILLLTTAVLHAQSASNSSPQRPTATPATAQSTLGATQTIVNSTQPVVASPAPAFANDSATPAGPTAASARTDADAVQKRMERARALAAAHQLAAATSELETIRASIKDEVVRNVSSLMLMGIYLEDGNYARAESLLEETFKSRSSNSEASLRTYFALSGQALIGARSHVARYRTFGINVSSASLPSEALNDLDRLRLLLERMAAQAKELMRGNAKNNDAFALIEDIAGLRATLARDTDDRAKWGDEYSAARARLASLPTEIASIGPIPSMPSGGVESTMRSANASTNPSMAESTTPASIAATSAIASNPPASGPASVSEKNGGSPKPAANSNPAASVLEVGSLTEKATKRVVPPYPQIAKSAGASGLVRVKVVVDESGSVSSINWVEGPLLLRQAAQDAVRQWKFKPTLLEGKPVRVAGFIDFGFSR